MLVALGGAAAAPAVAQQGATARPPVEPELGRELTALRTRTSRTYVGERSNVTMIAQESINFRNGTGAWRAIDNTLERGPAGRYRNTGNRYELSLPERLGAAPIRMAHDGHAVEFSLTDAADVPGSANGAEMRYADALPGVTAGYEAQADGVKETLTLDSAQATSTFRFALNVSNGLRPRERADGGVDFVDGLGRAQMWTPAPFMLDAKGRFSDAVTLTVDRAGSGYVMTLAADGRWLRAAERSYPVVVDPHVSIAADRECTIVSGSEADVNHCGDELGIGWDGQRISRALLRFGGLNAAVPRDAFIRSTHLVLPRTSGSGGTLEAHELSRDWTTGATWNRYDGTNAWTTAGGDFASSPAASTYILPDNRYYLDVTGLVSPWVDGSKTQHGILVKARTESGSGNLQIFARGYDPDPYFGTHLRVDWQARTGLERRYSYETEQITDRLTANVNVSSGNLVLQHDDVSIGGVAGHDLVLTRFFNSRTPYSRPFGKGWAMNVGSETYVHELNGNLAVAVNLPSDRYKRFERQPDNTYRATEGPADEDLKWNADGTWRLKFNKTSERYRYDADGYLTSYEDRNGNKITYTRGGPNNAVTKITDTRGRDLTLAYNGDGHVSTVTDSTGRVHRYTYSGGLLTSVTSPDGAVTQYGYDPAGDLVRITDPRGNATRIAYDDQHRVTQIVRVTDAATDTGPTQTYSYQTSISGCPNGSNQAYGRTTVTDPKGNGTTSCWDRQLRITKVTDARGFVRQTTYTSNSDIATFTSPRNQTSGKQTAFSYSTDGRNNLTQVQESEGERTSFDYTNTAHPFLPTKSTSPRGSETTYEYDSFGNMTVTGNTAAETQTTIAYNASGTIDTVTDGNGNVTDYGYDGQQQLTSIDRPGTPANGQPGTETLGYDSLSRLTSYTDGKGQQRSIDYDTADRVLETTYSDLATVTNSYDASGNLSQRSDRHGTTSYVYDALNRLTRETFPSGRRNDYTYDRASNLTSITTSLGTTTYAYTAGNLLDTLTEPDGARTTFNYDADTNRTATSYPNGVTMSETWDDSGKLQRIEAKNAAGMVLTSYAYGYQDASTSENHLRTSVTDRDDRTTSFSYDGLDRLTRARTLNASGTEVEDYQYGYDANSNRISQTVNGSAKSFSYDVANQLTQAGSTTYTHDRNGNVTGNSDGQAFVYNAQDQTGRYTPAGGAPIDFLFLGDGQDEQYNGQMGQITPSQLGEIRADRFYFVRDNQGRLHSQLHTTEGKRYYLFDGLGTVVGLTDTSGQLTRYMRFDPFGKVTYANPNGFTPFQFAGGFLEETSGQLHHFGARLYDPRTGRWTQPDPLNQPSDLRQGNRYLYAGQDPVNLVDPTGEVPRQQGGASYGGGGGGQSGLSRARATGQSVYVRVTTTYYRFASAARTTADRYPAYAEVLRYARDTLIDRVLNR